MIAVLPTSVASRRAARPTWLEGPGGAAGDHADARLRDVLTALSAVVVQLDVAGCVAFVNDAFLDVTGWARSEVLGAEWRDGFVPAGCETQALFAAALGGVAARGQGELFTRDGDRRLVAWDMVPARDADRRVTGVTCVGRDLTEERRLGRERARLTRELATHADRDALTGVLNRRGFVRGTEHAARVAARTRRADAVLAVHLDALAATYAEHGAAAGDDAVCAVAEALRGVVRDSDVVARVADDTFAIYAVGTAAPNHAAATARRVRAALATSNARAGAAGRAFDVGCSVGAVERAPGEEIEALLARAAAASADALLPYGEGAAGD